MSNSENMLEVKNLYVSVKDEENKYSQSTGNETQKEILKGLNLTVKKGEVHVLMGTNGSGKSTLANALMGHPNYTITKGEVEFRGENLIEMKPEEKAKKGMFLAFQYPTAIEGLTVGSYLRAIVKAVNDENIPIRTFRKELTQYMEELNIPKSFLKRSLNAGFSGGEKKKAEILQMNLLKPKLIILDETDSGLDVDALRLVFENINNKVNNETSVIIITHYSRVLRYVHPNYVHIIKKGNIVKSGGLELSKKIEEEGFEAVLQD